jgi:hypothetical protein
MVRKTTDVVLGERIKLGHVFCQSCRT